MMNYKIIARYIKDLNFSIENAKVFFLLEKNISKYKINIDIKSNQFKEKIIEIETTLALSPNETSQKEIITKITYATVIEIEGDISSNEMLEEIILIKIPTEIYPDIRNIFIYLFEKCGFKKIKIAEKVNFKELYLKRKN